VAAHEAQARLVQRHAHRDAPLQLSHKQLIHIASSHDLDDDDGGGVGMAMAMAVRTRSSGRQLADRPCCRGSP
jgi:hypothetical protein